MAATRELLDRVERHCSGEHSAKALREAIVAELRRAIPFDGYVFAVTDPVTRVATAPLADVPGLPWERLPELIRWRYQTTINRWTEMLDAGESAASLLATTCGEPSASPLWHNVQRDLGVTDSASVVFGDRYGCWGFLELLRRSPVPFAKNEIALLSALSPMVTAGLRRALARTFVAPAEHVTRLGPAVVILGPDLAVRNQTAGAAEALAKLLPPDEPISPIPAAVYNIGAALIASENGVPVGPPWSRVNLGGSRWLTVRADRIGGEIAVSIEVSTSAERMDLFARTHALSARETEVLELLATGLDTKEIAAALVLSDHTVNDHVKAVLAKCGARNRQVLLSRAHGG
ncbi:helix-turn-helix transcriptional regulator [Antrihabitans sp. YC2-6]|uniref:response regulator transcription factor n=1 Tax=Antrihabitans sp. YC2-6 TaxID=2799498 RepID=UPI0018F4F621|nr:helix-turn-helix transcriptional regulator [Antrihabitans sp. YC2-6]MBJ8348525.1 LuxR family transcriptional regulator [Antrihabitans sp. YC2-6]